MPSKCLHSVDDVTYDLIQQEALRQEHTLELIASENATSQAVLETQGSLLTNKYAEGYPQKRYYGGCNVVDKVEQLAIQRALEAFGAEAANVQPHSGSSANMAVYLAELNPGDVILGMNLNEGGHLTHGHPANFSGKLFQVHAYGINHQTGRIDMNEVSDIAKKVRPKMIIAGASAYSRVIDFKAFREIADAVGAVFMADIAHTAGLIAAGLHPSPVPHADYVTTTTHKTLRGPRGGLILCKKERLKKLNASLFPGIQGGPLMHIIAAKAVILKEALSPEFKQYQKNVLRNARHLSNELIKRGFNIISGGTDTHLFLVSLMNKNITGKQLENALDRAHITLNKNAIPKDPLSPFITSGVRIGTPTVTTRGMGTQEMNLIAEWIELITKHADNLTVIQEIKEKVIKLTHRFPMFKKESKDKNRL